MLFAVFILMLVLAPSLSYVRFSPLNSRLSHQHQLQLQPLNAGSNSKASLQETLSGKTVIDVTDGRILDLELTVQNQPGPTLLVLGTYAADFNAIEYAQRLNYYLPQLKAKGIANFIFILNASPQACKEFRRLLSVPDEITIVSDSLGAVGQAFSVSRGWRPDDATSPYVKLFGMLFGLGAVMTLPSVIGGYIGNPWSKQPWIEASLATNQKKGIWPDNALELNADGSVKTNKFTELPYVGSWGRRPLELATLRLQNMLGISLKNWRDLRPTEEELQRGLLTQLGGLVVIDKPIGWATSGSPRMSVVYKWLDDGICDVCNFEQLLEKI